MQLKPDYPEVIEKAANEIAALLRGSYGLAPRAVALLVLQEDQEVSELVRRQEGDSRWQSIKAQVDAVKAGLDEPVSYTLAVRRQDLARTLAQEVVRLENGRVRTWGEIIGDLTMRPLVGIPVLLLVLYFGLYQVVGVFGAGTVVDYLEGNIFEAYINPWVNSWTEALIPWPVLQDLIAHEYGIITLGLRYAVAIILPIVGSFFLVFSVIEDSGYLPRLALLVDRVFKEIGLSGRAVIPITLGFGCDTMATLVSRTLETRRERIIATLLLALAIPCSAQLGVILSLLASHPRALLVWAGFLLLIFLLVGYLTAQLMPGDGPSFYMEVPPLRLPQLTNVLTKTYTRMQWYFLEIVPLFVLASVLIWLGNITGFFNVLIQGSGVIAGYLGLPPEAGEAFLFGFFRRDYGAAGLYDLASSGALSPRQLTVAAATLTLFVPCIAQFSVMVKERGWGIAFGMVTFIFPFAFAAGFVLNAILMATGVLG
ncbi:MAG: ferrous iron transporter B [Firmicutes bacterium]|jgi:ferrous iron transport protein B|nr:ferrous iron transporter B [Bacillota bacterium]